MPRRLVDTVDAYQRAHRWLGFPLAVVYKFADDQGPYLAALITFYGFLSLFPLLLLLVTILGFVLDGDPDLQAKLIDSALVQFPVIGSQLRENVQSLKGSGIGLAVGILATRYGCLGAAMASRFTPEALATQHERYLVARGGTTTSQQEALEALEAHSTYGLLPENLAKPRIVLLASSIPPVVTATTVWLTEMSLDISLMRLQAYRAEDRSLLRRRSFTQCLTLKSSPSRGVGRHLRRRHRATARARVDEGRSWLAPRIRQRDRDRRSRLVC
jgi:Virulence factor BrkB